jgi:hypothetical protein
MSAAVKAALAIVALVVLALTVRWILGKRNEDERVIIPPETQARIDSLERTADSATTLRLEKQQLADSATRLAAALRAATRPARDSGAAAGNTADSLAILAQRAETARDSAVLWHTAYVARTTQVGQLETVVAAQDAAAVQDSVAIDALRSGWAADVQRLAAETQTRRELQAAIAKANECRLLWVVDCPTRTQAAIGGALLSGAIALWGDDLVDAVKSSTRDRRARLSLSVRF